MSIAIALTLAAIAIMSLCTVNAKPDRLVRAGIVALCIWLLIAAGWLAFA